MTERAAPPEFSHVFDWRLVTSLVFLVLTGVMSCDLVNSTTTKAFALPGEPPPQAAKWKPGYTDEVDITLITKDAGRLACADDRTFEGKHCGYDAKKHRVRPGPGEPRDNNQLDIIQPYRTAVGNHLVMIAGLWATPEVALRHHLEPPIGISEKKLRRFVARCRLRFVGELNDVMVRWKPSQKWYQEKKGPVAIAESCRMKE